MGTFTVRYVRPFLINKLFCAVVSTVALVLITLLALSPVQVSVQNPGFGFFLLEVVSVMLYLAFIVGTGAAWGLYFDSQYYVGVDHDYYHLRLPWPSRTLEFRVSEIGEWTCERQEVDAMFLMQNHIWLPDFQRFKKRTLDKLQLAKNLL